MKKYLFPLFVLIATAIGFASCSDDDDDDDANVSISVNGKAIDNDGTTTLTKGTVLSSEGTEGVDDVVSLSITSDKNITGVQVSVKNDFESNVAVTDTNDNVLNDKFAFSTSSTEKSIAFVGVYGEYTVKIATEGGDKTYKFKLTNTEEHLGYTESDNRYLSNKQVVYFDSDNKEYSNKAFGLTYNKTEKAGQQQKNFGNAKLTVITEKDYNNNQGSKGSFYINAAEKEYASFDDISTSDYLIFKNDNKYYLIHIVSINDNILKAEIQY